MQFICTQCRASRAAQPEVWRCPSCGGVFDLDGRPPFRAEAIEAGMPSLWRYGAMIRLPDGASPVSMGEGMTPLLPARLDGKRVLFKLDYVSPTGSFKDRGTSVLVTALRGWGVERAADDSSGNAGASFAA